MRNMESLPIFIKIKDARCLVIGGGEVALRKVTTLLKAEAKVEVVAPALCDDLVQLLSDGKIAYQQSVFDITQLNGAVLVFAATDDEAVNEDDTLVTKGNVTLLIDSMSFQYLVGAEIDYKEDINGSQFVIKNPNATTTCGCGSSFSA